MKYWIDVSGLYHWSGNFTGIQRVVYNLSKEFTSSDIECGFYVYHTTGRFTEVSFEALEARIQEASKVDNSKKAPGYKFKNPVYYIIVGLKRLFLNTRFEKSLRRIYGVSRNTYRKLTSLPNHTPYRMPFKKDDVVIVIDGNWLYNGFTQSIASAKSKRNFYLVHFVQDLIAYTNPALVNEGATKLIGDYFQKIFKSADQLIAISNSTKHDIESFLSDKKITNKPKIGVIRLGDYIYKEKNLVPEKPAKQLPDKFILAVSTIEIRKNYMAFYYIYNLASEKGIDLPDLVIVGKKGWMIDETYSLITKDPKVSKKITILNSNDSELEWIYKNCLFTVFPSLYEGWGLPVAESLAHGKCCISSNTSSMPEVGGELVNYVSPYDTLGFLNEIIKLTKKELRATLEKKIAAEYKPVTWKETFSQFISIVTDINE